MALCLKQGFDVSVTRGNRLEGASARSFGENGYRAPDRIIVISAKMRVVPVEAVLVVQFEAISEIASRCDGILVERSVWLRTRSCTDGGN